MNRWIDFLKAVLAGMYIATGCICYLSVNNKVIGAFLFSVGLLVILTYDLKLYTGMIGRARKLKDIYRCTIVLTGNMYGCAFIYSLTFFTSIHTRILPQLEIICANKTETPLTELFFLGVICGGLMSTATKKKNNYLVSIMCVMVFILVGAEHSVADAFYLLASDDIIQYLKIFVVAFGNALGAMATDNIISLSTYD